MNSDDKWAGFEILCRAESDAKDVFVVTFNRKISACNTKSEKSNSLSSGAVVTVESGVGMLVAIEFKPPEIATAEIEEHDYSEKAFQVVREKVGET